MRVVLIDDEQHALDLLEFHLTTFFEDVAVVEKFQSAAKALLYLKDNTPDLIFSDIDMPGLNGLEAAKLLQDLKAPVVFVTAHSSYAIEAIKIDAFDYLLKPINEDELRRVYEKFKSQFEVDSSSEVIEFKISNRHVIARPDEVLYVKSEGNYSTVYFVDRPELMITKNMKKMEEEYFSSNEFFRSHRSFLINLKHLLEFNGHEITLTGDHKISLARAAVDELKKVIASRS